MFKPLKIQFSTGYNWFADTAIATLLIHKLPLLLDLPLHHITKFHTAHYLKQNLHLSFLWLSTHFTLVLEFN